jgi:hypothetical protein
MVALRSFERSDPISIECECFAVACCWDDLENQLMASSRLAISLTQGSGKQKAFLEQIMLRFSTRYSGFFPEPLPDKFRTRRIFCKYFIINYLRITYGLD